jgi:CDP-diacylglycerol---glycerol-3-phosphate 3-phosphatidyltransferase
LNLPNGISFLRILLVPLLVLYLLSTNIPNNLTISAVIFSLVAISDYFDGYLARKLKQETTLGKFLDPLADKILVITALLCLVELDVINTIPIMILIVRDFSVSALRLVAASDGKIIAADMLGKYKAAILDIGVVFLILGIPGSVQFLWVGVLLSVVSGVSIFYKNWSVFNGR